MGLAGPSAGQSIADWVRENASPSVVGGSEIPEGLLDILRANYGNNYLQNGSMESWSAGTTSAPDKWTLTGAGATVARNGTNVQDGLYAADFTAALNTATDLGQSITISSTQNTRLRGKKMTFACLVKVGTASRVFLRIDDGIGTKDSVFHEGDGTFRNLIVTRTLDAAATKAGCSIEVSSGASITVTCEAAILVEGDAAPAFSLNFLDKALAISNYQNTTPTNAGDQGIWRTEIGEVSIAGNTAVTSVAKTVTFAGAFRTVRDIFITASVTDSAVGAKRGIWGVSNVGTNSFVANHVTADAAVYADTTAGTAYWMAIGQV